MSSDAGPRTARTRTVVLTALGVTAGSIASYTFHLEKGFLQAFAPGLVYGAVVALYLYRTNRADAGRAAAVVILSAGSWRVAVSSAIEVYSQLRDLLDWTDIETAYAWKMAASGVSGGVVGAALLVSGFAMLFGFFESWRLRLATVACGGAAGACLALVEAAGTSLVLFAVWQGAFSVCLARAMPDRHP